MKSKEISPDPLRKRSLFLLGTFILAACSSSEGSANATIAEIEDRTVATGTAEVDPFPDELRTQLEEWAEKQEGYKEILISPASEGGYDVTIQNGR